MGVDHGGTDVFMAQELLNGANIVAIFQQMGSKAMAACFDIMLHLMEN
jgi:hypothetical protein